MKRIFYYSGYRMTVFHWKNDTCIATFTFNPGDQGIEKFKIYLNSTANIPIRLLVDLIEEDFKKENIPHVNSSDRKAIIRRLIDRQYRKSKDYVHYKIIDREKTGRKDDVILYSVLSNPEILEPWLAPIRECNISISGIWSLPLLSENLFSKLKNKESNVLLVSQQVPSNLRQTFIKNGHFESSRSAVVNLEDATIGEYIAIEIEQTIRFLSNQRQIGFDEKIYINIICREEDLKEIKSRCIDTPMRIFNYYNISTIQALIGCKTLTQTEPHTTDYSNSIYSYVCAKKILPVGHYGPQSLFKSYYNQILSRALNTLSFLTIAGSIIYSLSSYTDSTALKNEIIVINNQINSVNNSYENIITKYKGRLSNAHMMQSSVLLANKIKQQASISPQKFMSDISQILSKHQTFNTQITKITWKQYQRNEFDNKNDSKTKIDYAKHDTINQYATIGGYIQISKTSLKKSVDKVNSIVHALEKSPLIKKVKIKNIPVDARSASSIENETGTAYKGDKNSDKNKGQFEIELLMAGKDS